MVKLVNTADLKSAGASLTSSILVPGTKNTNSNNKIKKSDMARTRQKATKEVSLYATKCQYADTHKYRYIGQSEDGKDIYRCKYCLIEVAMTPLESIKEAIGKPNSTKAKSK